MGEKQQGIRTVYKTGTGELVERKSRFLSFLYGVESEEEINQLLEDVRKRYWDARHVCYAYVLGERGEQQRFSDDGEPSGTAGKPILDVLTGADLIGVLLVVVRYFGGVLLGTGGLVRAYSGAARKALEGAVVITKLPARKLDIVLDYTALGKVQYLLNQEALTVDETEYSDNVTLKVPVPLDRYDEIKAKISDATSGTAKLLDGEEVHYALVDKKIIYL